MTWEVPDHHLRIRQRYLRVVAARAATAGSEHGAEGGAAGLGSVRHTAKKARLDSSVLPPPAIALGEVDGAPAGDSEGDTSFVPIPGCTVNANTFTFRDPRCL